MFGNTQVERRSISFVEFGRQDKARKGAEVFCVFKEKYIPQAVRDAKCSELLGLKQRGAMTVADYEYEFTNLVKYGSRIIDTDSRKAPEIRNVVCSSFSSSKAKSSTKSCLHIV